MSLSLSLSLSLCPAEQPGEGKTLLKEFTYEFSKGDCVGIVGPNGVGKSTFVKMLAGIQAPTGGSINIGETVVIGHYEQQVICRMCSLIENVFSYKDGFLL